MLIFYNEYAFFPPRKKGCGSLSGERVKISSLESTIDVMSVENINPSLAARKTGRASRTASDRKAFRLRPPRNSPLIANSRKIERVKARPMLLLLPSEIKELRLRFNKTQANMCAILFYFYTEEARKFLKGKCESNPAENAK